jgi:hypothetical protein
MPGEMPLPGPVLLELLPPLMPSLMPSTQTQLQSASVTLP